MKNLLLVCIFVSFSINLTAQTTLILKAARDASLGYHDNYNTEDRNYSNAIQNAAYYIPGFTGGINCNRALIDFDLSSVPSGAKIIEARLSLYSFNNYPEGTMVRNGHFGENASYLRRVTSTWNEFTATWNIQPQTTDENQVILHKSIHPDEDYLNINITPLVIDMIENPAESYGLLLGLMQEKEYANLSFHSKEGPDSSKHPVLRIVYQTEGVDPTEPIDPDPVDPNPIDPVDPNPIDPVDPDPIDPVDPDPIDPVDPDPIDPVDPDPIDPVDPDPIDPVDPDPIEPIDSDPADGDDIGALPQVPEISIDPRDFDFIIYPNPGRLKLKIIFKNRESKHVLMYTIEGKILFSKDSEELIQKIDVEVLAPGIYFIQCRNETKTITRKYVKMAD